MDIFSHLSKIFLENNCTDTAAWSDGWGETCEYYLTKGVCENGEVKDGQVLKNSAMFNFPEKNCCVCGKIRGKYCSLWNYNIMFIAITNCSIKKY